MEINKLEERKNHNFPYWQEHYTHDVNLINKIFPLEFNPSIECFARDVASKIGYNDLCDLNKGEIVEVDINTIHPCQSVLAKTRLIELMIYLRDHEVPGYPMGIKIGNDVYLLDGHHRTSAQILMGKKTVMIHLTVLKEDDEIVKSVRNPKSVERDFDH